MNRKGFTLIELLGVILIISLLVIIVLPRITNSVNSFSTKTDKLMMNMITEAAKFYVEDNPSEYEKENGRNYCVSIGRLVDEGYLKEFNNNGQKIENLNPIKVTYNNGFEYALATDEECYPLVKYIKNLYSETKTTTVNGIEYGLDENHSLMNDRLGSSSVRKTAGNIRYYGANPNNYIDIGDRDSQGNIIFWRIIGLFKDVEVTDEEGNVIGKEDLVKIIRADVLISNGVSKLVWDYTEAGEHNNNWNHSTLQLMLNDKKNGYYGSGITSYYNNSTTPIELNFSSIGLSSEVHKKVEKVNWYLGLLSTSDIYTDVMYGYERNTTEDPWSGKIGLMYPSDYGYSTDLNSCKLTLTSYDSESCQGSNWMYFSRTRQWTISPHPNSGSVVVISLEGRVGSVATNNAGFTVRPALYLKSDVSIVEEKETNEGIKYLVVQ